MKHLAYPIAALLLLTLFSCDEFSEKDPENRSAALIDFNSVFTTQKDTDKRLFSEALVESMHQSSQLRQLIKTEALTRFNNDTEVLYLLIKDKPVENGTVHDVMAANTKGGRAVLDGILSAQPLLTILVPTLPEGSFSAESWDADRQVPAVGIRLSNCNDTAFIWDTGLEEVIPGDYIPGFPAIVIKENERLVISTDPMYTTLNTNIVYNPATALPGGPGIAIRYAGKAFDGLANPAPASPPVRVTDPKLIQAYTYGIGTNDWQRDYIYYGIHPGQQNGAMDYSFTEAIGEFTMEYEAKSAYGHLADHTGGIYGYVTPATRGSARNYWTEGFFDFNMKTYINAISGAPEVNGYISINPAHLFELQYKKHSGKKWLLRSATWYTLESAANKVYYANAPLTDWNIRDKSTEWKISVEEVDLAAAMALPLQYTIQRPTNFSQEPGGEFIKHGPKYGASLPAMVPYTNTNYYTVSGTPLGDALISFADDVILETGANPETGTPWHYRHYSTGSVTFTVEPVRVGN